MDEMESAAVGGQKLAVISAIPSIRVGQLLGEEPERIPNSVKCLFQYLSNGGVRRRRRSYEMTPQVSGVLNEQWQRERCGRIRNQHDLWWSIEGVRRASKQI